MASSPFGRYATVVAAAIALLVVLAWLASVVGLVNRADALDAAFYVVLGAAIPAGAAAQSLAASAGAKAEADAAHARLDAVGAPAASSLQVTSGPITPSSDGPGA